MNATDQKLLEDRLHNWGDWARAGGQGGGTGRCGSAEGRYIAPRSDEVAQERKLGLPIDYADAELIEVGVSRLQRQRDRLVLKAWYVESAPPRWWRERLALRRQDEIRAMVVMCVGALQRQLHNLADERTSQARVRSNMYKGPSRTDSASKQQPPSR